MNDKLKAVARIGIRNLLLRAWQAVLVKFYFYPKIISYVRASHGLEVGGSSKLFKRSGWIPIYNVAEQVDVCNFGEHTHWEGRITNGFNFQPDGKIIGYQYICAGDFLGEVQNESLDFVLSCHNLEHFANPLKAVEEWVRVLRRGGLLLLVLPDPTYTFDHYRPVTSFDHLLEDFAKNIGEDDDTHYNEAMELTDLNLYPKSIIDAAGSFEKLCANNFENRCLHHHVFDFPLLEQILNYFKLKEVARVKAHPHHLVIAARRPS